MRCDVLLATPARLSRQVEQKKVDLSGWVAGAWKGQRTCSGARTPNTIVRTPESGTRTAESCRLSRQLVRLVCWPHDQVSRRSGRLACKPATAVRTLGDALCV